jgi:hypothetical protein
MRRREFLLLFGGTAAAWPRTARAQHPTPVIGFLSSVSPGSWTDLVAAFRSMGGLAEPAVPGKRDADVQELGR